MMKIDSFCHILPEEYARRFFALDDVPAVRNLRKRVSEIPALVDMDVRLQQMEEFGADYRQIINVAAPPVEDFGNPSLSAEFARIGNEGLAELVRKHPQRFAGFTACVPLNDVDAALKETDYAFDQLGALGVQIYTHVNGRPLDSDEFLPFWERMQESDKVIQVHPCRTSAWPDYPSESKSKYEIWWTFGWEYDLSAFMARVVFGGVLERFPDLKFLIHHGGSMVPHFSGRVGPGWDQLGARTPDDQLDDINGYPLSKRPIDYFRMFYADTALFGASHALKCTVDFYGADRVLFASDSPYDPEGGPGYIRSSIRDVAALGLDDDGVRAIYELNARRLFGLD